MSSISAVVITYNEEGNINECLSSLNWVDEIIIIDSGSTDNTVNMARKYTDLIIISENIPYGVKRNIGFEKAGCEWILWIDADERITEPLKKEILDVINKNRSEANLIRRKSFFINKFIKYCGWYPDYTLRLFKRSLILRFNDAAVHEKIIYNGLSKKLTSDIVHYTDKDFEQYINKMNYYTSLSAAELSKKNKKTGVSDILFRPVFTFLKMYFAKLGFLDGYTGLILCILSSYHVFFKYSKSIAK